MSLKKYYSLKATGKKVKEFWKTLVEMIKRESVEEVKTSDDEVRMYESNPLFSVRGRVIREEHDKTTELEIIADSKTETLYMAIFGIIGLFILMDIIWMSPYGIVSGIVGAIVYYYIINYFIKAKEKEMVRNLREYVEEAARKTKVELE